ncbi:competence type IV pilus major pilin ComGC [Calidifontibacillus oryziterrae]|uniref:competence type IV pilus major pilin ComGC n=1 Tax=Calidifontibacillus oryziterrae TaxID=1191699 RepID=UPI00030D67A3|nr:competence type IV pilus major pilin ComGC [Calidifontibacillus oryziterrae]
MRFIKNQLAFTLIEMMVVLMIISILLLITIPNITKNNSIVKDKGCEALVKLIEAQVQAYEIETGTQPESLDKLVEGGYIETYTCPGDLGDISYVDGVVFRPTSDDISDPAAG